MLKNCPRTDKLIIASGVIGNLLENFDVMICAFLAHFIALTFFPTNSLENNIFYTFNIFFIAYLSRPLGSLFIGLYADQIGRKKMLVFSIIMVGFCTAIIGFIPSYESIGIASTVLFSFFKILQNISLGGEYICSISYLIESANSKKQGFYGSWVSVGYNLGNLFASIIVFLLILCIEEKILPSWCWRIIFIFAVFGAFIGLWIRQSLPESIRFILENSNSELKTKQQILKTTIKLIKQNYLQCFSISTVVWLGVTQTSALFAYSPIHMELINTHHFPQLQVLGLNTICLLFLVPLIPLFGFLSDHYNKTTLLTAASLMFLVLAFPYFWFLSYGNYLQILIIKFLFCIPSACFYAIAPVLITDVFPVKLRCTSLALIYHITASLAAGLTPLVMFQLVKNSKYPYSPAYFLIFSIILCLIGLTLLIKEQFPKIEITSSALT